MSPGIKRWVRNTTECAIILMGIPLGLFAAALAAGVITLLHYPYPLSAWTEAESITFMLWLVLLSPLGLFIGFVFGCKAAAQLWPPDGIIARNEVGR